MANPYFPPKSSSGPDAGVAGNRNHSGLAMGMGGTPNPILRPARQSQPSAPQQINTNVAPSASASSAGGGDRTPTSGNYGNTAGSRISFDQRDSSRGVVPPMEKRFSTGSAGRGTDYGAPQQHHRSQPHASAYAYAQATPPQPSSGHPGTFAGAAAGGDPFGAWAQHPNASQQTVGSSTGPYGPSHHYSRQPISPAYANAGTQAKTYRLSYSAQQQQQAYQQQGTYGYGYPPRGPQPDVVYPPIQQAGHDSPSSAEGSSGSFKKGVNSGSEGSTALVPAHIAQKEDLEADDGVHHPATKRPLDPAKLNDQQKKIAKMFPDDLDEEGGSLIQSMIAVVKDWRSFMKWSYVPYYILFVVIIVVVALMTIYHRQIVDWMTPLSKRIREIPAGWLIPVALLFIISFPPLFGHEIVAVLCGVVYGLWIGFGIVAFGTLLGEIGNFYAFKTFLAKHAEKYERKSINYACMAHIVRTGGFLVVFLARLSAIPGHFTTAVFATCGMNIWIFVLAAILSMPKQLSVVYLGYVIEQSGDSGNEPMSSRIVKYVVLFISVAITLGAAWYLYGKMYEARPVVRSKLKSRRYTMLSEARRTDNISSGGEGMSKGVSTSDDLYQNGGAEAEEEMQHADKRRQTSVGGSLVAAAAKWMPRAASGAGAARDPREGEHMLMSSAAPFASTGGGRNGGGGYSTSPKDYETSSWTSHDHDDGPQPKHNNDFETFGRREMHEFGPSLGAASDLDDPERTLGITDARRYVDAVALGKREYVDPFAEDGGHRHPFQQQQHPALLVPGAHPATISTDALSARSSPPHYDSDAYGPASGQGHGHQQGSSSASNFISAHDQSDPLAPGFTR